VVTCLLFAHHHFRGSLAKDALAAVELLAMFLLLMSPAVLEFGNHRRQPAKIREL
jgi:hypothetical protein